MAAQPKVRLVLAEDELQLHADPGKEILEFGHTVYLTNVLGLELSDEFEGYRTPVVDATPQLMSDISAYLSENGFNLDAEQTAKEVLDRLESDRELLEGSRSAGLLVKNRPPKTFTAKGFKRPLKSYQIGAAAHLVAVHNGANFSVPGSGKTTMVLAAFAKLREQGAVDTIVVVGPRSCFMPWEEEYKECFGKPARSRRIVGPKAVRNRLYRDDEPIDLVLLTYQMASNDYEDVALLLKKRKAMLVLDESHNIKRLEGGKWSEALVAVAPFAARRVVLSGTPAPNSLLDVWSQFAFLWPADPILGAREHFKHRVEVEPPEHIRDELRPFFWRVTKKDLKLPTPTWNRIEVPMGPQQETIYQALAAKVLSEVIKAPEDRARLRFWRRSRMIRLIQAASNPTLLSEFSVEFKLPPLEARGLPVDRLIEHYSDFEVPSKLDAAVKLARKIAAKEKVVIWTTFVHNIKTLQEMLSDLQPDAIYGEIARDETEDAEVNREKIIREFKRDDDRRVLIANPGACAESISLHKACYHAIYLDRTFNAAHYLQSLDRIHRVGLQPHEKVHYYILQSRETIDLTIDQRLEEKKARLDALLNEQMPVVDLDQANDEVTEDSEEDADFNALIASLKATVRVSRE